MFFFGWLGMLITMVVLGSLLAAAGVVIWALFLPFRLLGFLFRSLAFLLFLPFTLVIGLGILLVIGLPLLLTVGIFAAPAILLMLGVVWLARRAVRRAAA